MLIPTILSRITLLLILAIPIVIVAYYYCTNKMNKFPQATISPIFAGFLLSSIMFFLFYWKLGILEYSMTYITNTISSSVVEDSTEISKSHTISSLLAIYLHDFKRIIIGSSIFIAGIYFLSLLKDKTPQYLFNMAVISMTFALIIVITFIAITFSRFPVDDFFALNILKVANGIILIFCAIYLYKNKTTEIEINVLLITGLFVMLVTPIGSDGATLKAMYGMWLILPLSILSLSSIQKQLENRRLNSIISLMGILLASLLILSIFFQVTNIYRDDQNRINLNSEFSDPTLKGVYSTSERTKVVDDTLAKIREHSNKGDTTLMVNSIPMFYYLTETKPSHGNPWLFLKSIDKIKQKQELLEDEKNLPVLFVYSKINTWDRNWPNSQIDIREEDSEKLDYLKNRYIKDLNYTLIWENDAFAIYGQDV